MLQVDDLPARLEKLKQAGVLFRNEMEVGPGGRQIQIEDPDANPIEVVRAGWLVRNVIQNRLAHWVRGS